MIDTVPEAPWLCAADDLVAFWSRLGTAHVHLDDAAQVSRSGFALDLHPVPWAGPVRPARMYLLFLNPGLSGDEAAEEAGPAFAQAPRANLAGDQPYPYLLGAHATHPGYRWARQTFGADIAEADAPGICVLQLVPYHSEKGGVARSVASTLPSALAIRRFVHEGVLPRVRAGQAGLVVARSAKLWGKTTEEPGVVVYAGAEPRRAFQTSVSRGGRLLRRMLKRPL